MEITRHFVRVEGREVHYRRTGSGPPFVLFHVSPQTSAFVLPQFLPLAEQYTLIALDNPGYGESDGLVAAAPTMADYADAVAATLTALGIERAPLYGSHTGANIAVEIARRFPQQVAGLILDGLSLSTPEVAQDRTAHYAPPFVPTAGGEHLAWAWQHTRDQLLFWPWYEPHRANRLRADVKSADYLHDVVLEKMAAADYWLGYRAAFSHDSRDALRELTVDTYFVTAGDDAHTEIERSLSGLPSNIHFIDTSHDTQLDAVKDALAKLAGDSIAPTPPAVMPRQALYRAFVDGADGQRLVRRGGYDDAPPLVMLHGGMATSATLGGRATGLAAKRPIVAIDIAGCGDSAALGGAIDLEDFAEDIRQVVSNCGIDEFDLYGESNAAVLALEVARQTGAGVKRVVLDRPEMPAANIREALVAQIAPPIEARWDGSHFLTAWHMLRDAAIFWPWYERTAAAVRDIEPEIEPRRLQEKLLAWLKGRLTYGDFMRASFSVEGQALLSAVRQPTLVFGTQDDLLEAHARRAAEALANGQFLSSNALTPSTAEINRFLGQE